VPTLQRDRGAVSNRIAAAVTHDIRVVGAMAQDADQSGGARDLCAAKSVPPAAPLADQVNRKAAEQTVAMEARAVVQAVHK
jgi:hypothetical protein